MAKRLGKGEDKGRNGDATVSVHTWGRGGSGMWISWILATQNPKHKPCSSWLEAKAAWTASAPSPSDLGNEDPPVIQPHWSPGPDTEKEELDKNGAEAKCLRAS